MRESGRILLALVAASLTTGLAGCAPPLPPPPPVGTPDTTTPMIVFGDVYVDTSSSKGYQLRNIGTGPPLIVVGHLVTAGDVGNFTPERPPAGGYVLARGDTRTIAVTFSPDQTRVFRGPLVPLVSTGAPPPTPPFPVQLQGRGVNQQARGDLSIGNVPASETLSFGLVPVQSTKTLPLDIVNSGTAPLTLTVVWPRSDPRFNLAAPPATLVVPPNGVLRLMIQFSPLRPVRHTAVIELQSGQQHRAGIVLTGLGAA